jgi:hypothetical protein
MRQPVAQHKQRDAEPFPFAAPTAGWISNRNIAQPQGQGAAPGAAVLENFFPTATSAVLRRGSDLYATLGQGDKPVTSMFTYKAGNQDELFAATEDAIYNISVVPSAFNWTLGDDLDQSLETDTGDTIGQNSTDNLDVLSATVGGDWITVQFATAGGIFLRGVNGEDTPFVYDGATFEETPALTFAAPDAALTPDILSFVWAYKQRLLFIQKDTLDAWYLPVDSIGGELVKLPLGGIFGLGGSLLFGATWSIDSGNQGGLSEQCIFVTTEGEVAVFQGSNPSVAADWSKVGVYRIGKPLGKRAFMRAGGDIVIATSIGFVPISQAIQRDYAALAPAAVSFPIETAWNEAVELRSAPWNVEVWAKSQMVLVAPPTVADTDPIIFAANARTGAWAPFTNWDATCLVVWKDRMFFGSQAGKVVEANVSGLDQGETYTGSFVPLFDTLGTSASLKIPSMARFTVRAQIAVDPLVTCQFDYVPNLPSAPDAPLVPIGNQWGNAIWGESVWAGRSDAVISRNWYSVAGTGYALAPSLQITSGSVVPLDAEIISADLTYRVAAVVT